jgi:hypothetical protein
MGLYKLNVESGAIEKGVLQRAKTDSINYEKDFENWLENSPSVLLDDAAETTVIWIGRQVSTVVGDTDKYPDLIGIDSDGDLVIVELKKGKTPREVIAQILEYAAWGEALSYEDLDRMVKAYYKAKDENFDKSLHSLYREVFYPDADSEIKIDFNRNQKLYIVAEEISPVIKQVATHLRTRYKINIHCLEYEVLKTGDGDYFISTEKIVGYDEIKKSINEQEGNRWNEPVKVKTIVEEAVNKFVAHSAKGQFTPSDIINEILKVYPEFNKNTARCQIIQDCVNHTSRKHYPSGQRDLYFRLDKGTYRLYNKKTDGEWNWKGEKIK